MPKARALRVAMQIKTFLGFSGPADPGVFCVGGLVVKQTHDFTTPLPKTRLGWGIAVWDVKGRRVVVSA